MSTTLAPSPLAACPDLRRGAERLAVPPAWGLPVLAGRLVELSGEAASATLTFATGLVAEAQRQGEPAAWIGPRETSFYPPDVAAAGVDLAALVVVWAERPRTAAQAADLLLRCGAFGLVILDLGRTTGLPLAGQTRLAALAKRHATALVCLTHKGAQQPSLGSLVSLRAEAVRVGRRGRRFRCEARVLKDKRHGPGWTHAELCDGPEGLC